MKARSAPAGRCGTGFVGVSAGSFELLEMGLEAGVGRGVPVR